MLSDDSGAVLEKFLRNGRQFFDPQFMSKAAVAATIGEEHRDFGETARLPMQLSAIAEIRIRIAAPHAGSHQYQPKGPANGIPSARHWGDRADRESPFNRSMGFNAPSTHCIDSIAPHSEEDDTKSRLTAHHMFVPSAARSGGNSGTAI
jgi:hypothetical protein